MEKDVKNEQDEITHVEIKKKKGKIYSKKMTKHIQKIMVEKKMQDHYY
jgi:hypothetical protein